MDRYDNILIMGLGMTGQSAISALQGRDFHLYVWDEDEAKREDLDETVTWYGEHDIEEIDLVIKSPGIPMTKPYIKPFLDHHIPIVSDIELAYQLTKAREIIAVTGTNGKTTITLLLDKLLKDSGLSVKTGGNVGIGILPLAVEATEEDILLMEVSSFQLQTTRDFRPSIAIISNIGEDHLDHHISVEDYQRSKEKIYRNQRDGDTLIINIDDPYLSQVGEEREDALVVSTCPLQQLGAYEQEGKLFYNLDGNTVYFMDRDEIELLGDHNTRNLLQILLAGLKLGIDPDTIRTSFRSMAGIEHRMERVGAFEGISIYNDSKGTNPDATEVAIKSMDRPTHLLLGGYDKGSDFTPLFSKFSPHVKKVYLYGDTKEKLKEQAEKNKVPYELFENMKEATQEALQQAQPGEVVLLSPACASWDQFKNYEERGRTFKEIVLSYFSEKNDGTEED